jgi:hypothetical protein
VLEMMDEYTGSWIMVPYQLVASDAESLVMDSNLNGML